MRVGVLAVQGAFAEHKNWMRRMGATCFELRQREDLRREMDLLILPGGESTVQGKLLRELDMFDGLRARILEGTPTLATCAGMILLADRIANDHRRWLGTMPVTVRRNAYGRQLGSFAARDTVCGVADFPMTFIRAPYVESVDAEVQVLARVDGRIVGAGYRHQLALAFHPELSAPEGPAVAGFCAMVDAVRRGFSGGGSPA